MKQESSTVKAFHTKKVRTNAIQIWFLLTFLSSHLFDTITSHLYVGPSPHFNTSELCSLLDRVILCDVSDFTRG